MKKSLILFGVFLVVLLLIYFISIPTMKMEVPMKGKVPRPFPKKEEQLPTLAPPDLSKVIDDEIKKLSQPAPPDLSKVIDDEIKKLSSGLILFNPPQEMKVGVKERVEARITKTITEDLSKGLKGRGLPQIEEIKVNTLMGVRLNGDKVNFDIKALSHEEQIVTGDGFTQWDWDVTPLKSGIQRLLLSVTIRIKIPNYYGEERKDYPVFERPIKVKVNPIYSLKNFIKSYWQWIVSTIIGSGIIGWIIKRILKKRRKGKRKKVI